MITELTWKILACPACGGALRRLSGSAGAACDPCACRFDANANGQLDVRLRGTKHYAFDFEYGAALPVRDGMFRPLDPAAARSLDEAGAAAAAHIPRDVVSGNRFSPELLALFPRATAPGQKMLDLGCGEHHMGELCRHTGFEYIGVDYDSATADLLADAHALPFRDDSFEFVLSVAVLEHLRHPWIAMREAFRVLRPGGRFVGTVAFLEGFHMDSYYHHSHLGTLNSLASAGFDVQRVAPNLKWNGLAAIAHTCLFPQLPAALSDLFVLPVLALHRAWTWFEHLARPNNGRDRAKLQLWTTGGFQFVATKPGRADPAPAAAPAPRVAAGQTLAVIS